MNTLVIYYTKTPLNTVRETIKDSICCFREHLPGDVSLVNFISGCPNLLKKISFDLIIIHYSFLAIKYSSPEILVNFSKDIKKLKGYKIVLPQDEYINSKFLNEFIKKSKIDHIFSLFHDKKDLNKVYPEKETGVTNINTVLPGYVNNKHLKSNEESKPFEERKIDIGYRARKNPFWLGTFSLRKWQIAEFFQKGEFKKMKIDISTKEKDVFIGKQWGIFIDNCKYFLGVEGGASLLDIDGKIRKKVDDYTFLNPQASFNEVSALFFEKFDNEISYSQLTPRIFEAVLRKSCLILMEGYYNGILIADVHYIPVKSDYSNIKEVLKKIKNVKSTKRLIENSYFDLVLSNKYSYESFVDSIIKHSNVQVQNKKSSRFTQLLFKIYIQFISFKNHSFTLLYMVYYKIKLINER